MKKVVKKQKDHSLQPGPDTRSFRLDTSDWKEALVFLLILVAFIVLTVGIRSIWIRVTGLMPPGIRPNSSGVHIGLFATALVVAIRHRGWKAWPLVVVWVVFPALLFWLAPTARPDWHLFFNWPGMVLGFVVWFPIARLFMWALKQPWAFEKSPPSSELD
ncbi:MAG TPA: hypothetical protein VF590_10720 [Isosphaeraceae bacterium]